MTVEPCPYHRMSAWGGSSLTLEGAFWAVPVDSVGGQPGIILIDAPVDWRNAGIVHSAGERGGHV